MQESRLSLRFSAKMTRPCGTSFPVCPSSFPVTHEDVRYNMTNIAVLGMYFLDGAIVDNVDMDVLVKLANKV